MLTATLLALAAAVIHASWNLAVKQSPTDRYLSLWGQFFMAGLIVLPFVVWFGMPARGWIWVAISGSVHLPYCVFLSRAYDAGDFSLVYPIARGGGAVLAAIGGVLLLSDRLSLLSALAIAIVALGLFGLAGKSRGVELRYALLVAAAIGVYSVSDAKGIRSAGTPIYALATHLGTATTNSVYGLVTGRRREMAALLRFHWRRLLVLGAASTLTYGLVQLAFERAPVGYVTALRESSVVIAAFVGWKRLGERAGARRLVASLVVAAGLVLLVFSRA